MVDAVAGGGGVCGMADRLGGFGPWGRSSLIDPPRRGVRPNTDPGSSGDQNAIVLRCGYERGDQRNLSAITLLEPLRLVADCSPQLKT